MSHLQILPSLSERVDPLVERFLDMREKLRWMMEIGGERVLLYQRKVTGTLCPNYDVVRRQHRSDIDTTCFDTNFVGGYIGPTEIFISIGSAGAVQKVTYYEQGLRREFILSNWTLWEPNLKNKDFFVRRDGSRHWIKDVTVTKWRHHIIRQLIHTEEIERSHPIYKIPIPGFPTP